jgi:hypothetical protein
MSLSLITLLLVVPPRKYVRKELSPPVWILFVLLFFLS